VSTLSLVFAVLTAASFIQGFWVLGAVLFQFSLIFDFIDGRLARLTKNTSYFGEFLDNFLDQIKAVTLVVALYIGYVIHYPNLVDHAIAIGLLLYLFLQEFSVIVWLFVEKNVDKKRETSQRFEDASGNTIIGKFMISVTSVFDKIGLRVIWSNIETNVILFSILPLIISQISVLLWLSNVMLALYLLPECYVAIKVIRAKDRS
jgi:phosphatidylglycerophosphate synthase